MKQRKKLLKNPEVAKHANPRDFKKAKKGIQEIIAIAARDSVFVKRDDIEQTKKITTSKADHIRGSLLKNSTPKKNILSQVDEIRATLLKNSASKKIPTKKIMFSKPKGPSR